MPLLEHSDRSSLEVYARLLLDVHACLFIELHGQFVEGRGTLDEEQGRLDAKSQPKSFPYKRSRRE